LYLADLIKQQEGREKELVEEKERVESLHQSIVKYEETGKALVEQEKVG